MGNALKFTEKGYIKISRFSATTYEEFKEALEELIRKIHETGADVLIVEADLIHEVLKGDDLTTSVWPVAIWEYPSACDYMLNNPPIATGTADVIVTDNDYFAWRTTHNRKNAYHLSAHGVLYAPDGEGMVFSGGFHGVWHPEWDKEIWKTKIVLN